jgi:endonuclease YncB( thermonuclease family)
LSLVDLLMISIIVLFTSGITLEDHQALGKCPNGYHKSPSGDCEKVVDLPNDLPRCPNGYHRSPDGECERVTGASTGSSSNADDRNTDVDSNAEDRSNSNSIPNDKKSPNIDGCQGQADCFRGKVTDIVDGDTLDISNVRIRLSLVNAPERGDDGYVEAKDFVESVCSIGTEAVVDEDDGQKEGSYDRLIGLVYCGDANMHDKISLNELLLRNGHAAVFEDFCSKSEFSLQNWVQSFGCK